MARQLSPLERLRQARQQRWLAERRQAIAEALTDGDGLAVAPCQVLLFGSRARGDWDGHSDTDLLVVAPTRPQADGLADRLLEAGVGDDVIAISLADWQAAAHSPSPHWRSLHAQAIPLYERPSPGLVVSG
ncbi:nucleotidyltransferase domain-containing protein [Vulcanococcus limneticus]|uniref:nucleotidyltransferase domain-containing protein n=1 Tax=Vulcanococcus limneticus TaxID=2170428 RepID=UPI00398BBD42